MTTDLFGHPLPESKNPRRLGRNDHLTFRGNASSGRHGWLRLTPAYSLHVVQELLSDLREGERVLEPFCGTGTTPLVAAEIGASCDAVDINPFLVWLAALKTTVFPRQAAQRLCESCTSVIDFAQREYGTNAWRPEIHQIEKWWDAGVLSGLAALFAAINSDRTDDGYVRDLLKLAFCRLAIQTAKVSFGHQSMSFKKATHFARPVFDVENNQGVFQETCARFRNAVNDIATTLDADVPQTSVAIHLGDSRDLGQVLSRRDYSRVVTSPPYPNRMSYIRELRPYMYWLGFLATGRQAGEMDWRAIGGTWGHATSQLNHWRSDGERQLPHPRFHQIVRDISARHPLLGRYVQRYFEDMQRHIHCLRDVLARGARCDYIVGNSKFYETLLPVEELFAAIFEAEGFVNVRIAPLRKRTSKKELFEFVVHAETP